MYDVRLSVVDQRHGRDLGFALRFNCQEDRTTSGTRSITTCIAVMALAGDFASAVPECRRAVREVLNCLVCTVGCGVQRAFTHRFAG